MTDKIEDNGCSLLPVARPKLPTIVDMTVDVLEIIPSVSRVRVHGNNKTLIVCFTGQTNSTTTRGEWEDCNNSVKAYLIQLFIHVYTKNT